MSQKNLDTVVRGMRAALARPEPDFTTMSELYSPDHVFVPTGAEMVEGQVRGARGYRAWRKETHDLLGAEHELCGAVDIGTERVLAVTTTSFKGSTSGLASAERMWNVVTVVGGKIVRTETFRDPAQALRAAGLPE